MPARRFRRTSGSSTRTTRARRSVRTRTSPVRSTTRRPRTPAGTSSATTRASETSATRSRRSSQRRTAQHREPDRHLLHDRLAVAIPGGQASRPVPPSDGGHLLPGIREDAPTLVERRPRRRRPHTRRGRPEGRTRPAASCLRGRTRSRAPRRAAPAAWQPRREIRLSGCQIVVRSPREAETALGAFRRARARVVPESQTPARTGSASSACHRRR